MLVLYENIRNRRIELNMTQDELAEQMGYKGKSMICKIEKGLVDLPQSKIVAFAKALGTSPASLMGWSEEDVHTAEEMTDTADLVIQLRNDRDLVQALKTYFKMPQDKKRHVIETIHMIGK